MRRIVAWVPAVTCCCCLGLPLVCAATEHSLPPLILAETYDGERALDVDRFWVSEKLDGVRAYWDGTQLWTRAGHPIAAPAWFTRGWPVTPMDGEIWGGRGRFESTSGIVRSAAATETEWRSLRYFVFDLPAAAGSFDRRLRELNELVAATSVDSLVAIRQERAHDLAELRLRLKRVEAQGGEGLMLHRADSLYVAARTDDLLKFKSFADAEAKVVGYVEGQGKYTGMMGALLVERPDGSRFKIGSGFTDAQRREPPPLGSWITYAYNGLTERGIPRFARFVRVREAERISL